MQLYYGRKGQAEEATQRWFEASDREWAADMPIWGNKRHVEHPVLTGDDGPLPKFRRWYSQFYSEDASSNTGVGGISQIAEES